MEDQMKEVLEVVRFLKENAVTKRDLAETEQRLEKNIIFGVAEFMEQNVLPQLDSMNNRMDSMSNRIDDMSNNMETMGKDLTLIKTALQKPILHY